jgi:hypothetical protein
MDMNPDHELQLFLAKMLPEQIIVHKNGLIRFECRDTPIHGTEWLYVCWLVEQTLGERDLLYFGIELTNLTQPDAQGECHWGRLASASWQQRATALKKVKGMK